MKQSLGEQDLRTFDYCGRRAEMWRKGDDIAARCLRADLPPTERRYVVWTMYRACDVKLRHADAHDCRAKDAVKV
jgi:hypothetical protein